MQIHIQPTKSANICSHGRLVFLRDLWASPYLQWAFYLSLWIGSIRVAPRPGASSGRAHQSEHAQNPARKGQRWGVCSCVVIVNHSDFHFICARIVLLSSVVHFVVVTKCIAMTITHRRLSCWNVSPGCEHTCMEVPRLSPDRRRCLGQWQVFPEVAWKVSGPTRFHWLSKRVRRAGLFQRGSVSMFVCSLSMPVLNDYQLCHPIFLCALQCTARWTNLAWKQTRRWCVQCPCSSSSRFENICGLKGTRDSRWE